MSVKLNLIACCIAAAAGVTLRSLMLFYTIDHSSGFIKNEYFSLALIIIALMLVAAVLVFFIGLFGKQKTEFSPQTATLIYSICEIVMAVAILNEAFFSSLLNYATTLQILMHKAAAVGSAVALLYAAFYKLTRREYSKVLTVVPITFFVSRIIIVFSEFASLATVSDTIIETAAMCLALITVLNFAKFNCGIELKSIKLCKAVAMLSFYVCLVGSLPRIIYLIANMGGLSYFANIPAFTIFAAAIFSAGAVLKFDE